MKIQKRDTKSQEEIEANRLIRVKFFTKFYAPKKGISNEQFAKQDENFKAACEAVGVAPSGRQASKYRNKQGKAYLRIQS